MRIIHLTALICTLTLLTACTQLTPAPDGEPETGGERLLATPPEGWVQVYQFNDGETRIRDFVPPGETREDWSALVSFESFTSPDVNPIDLLITEADTDRERCSFLNHFAVSAGLENGYPTSVRLMFCGEDATSGQGEAKLVKALASLQTVYVVRVTRRLAPFEVSKTSALPQDEVATWASWLRRIKLCDPSAAEHPCPD